MVICAVNPLFRIGEFKTSLLLWLSLGCLSLSGCLAENWLAYRVKREQSEDMWPGFLGGLRCAQNAMCTLRRKQKLEEIEKRRQEEEAQMEARRRELLSEEDGYWRRRMAQEVQTQALQEESIVKANPQVCHPSAWWQLSCVLNENTGIPSLSCGWSCKSSLQIWRPLVYGWDRI